MQFEGKQTLKSAVSLKKPGKEQGKESPSQAQVAFPGGRGAQKAFVRKANMDRDAFSGLRT